MRTHAVGVMGTDIKRMLEKTCYKLKLWVGDFGEGKKAGICSKLNNSRKCAPNL